MHTGKSVRELYHECGSIFEARLQRAKMSGQKIMVETEATGGHPCT
ncbi:hypothetical protein ABID19_002054 [Mesorhizobium robiniae]|uniref:Transposase n=1 Tax=Mesorhizobium robiniae TaxID=559315 RepID=A0ABV2GL50_9HYPH